MNRIRILACHLFDQRCTKMKNVSGNRHRGTCKYALIISLSLFFCSKFFFLVYLNFLTDMWFILYNLTIHWFPKGNFKTGKKLDRDGKKGITLGNADRLREKKSNKQTIAFETKLMFSLNLGTYAMMQLLINTLGPKVAREYFFLEFHFIFANNLFVTKKIETTNSPIHRFTKNILCLTFSF